MNLFYYMLGFIVASFLFMFLVFFIYNVIKYRRLPKRGYRLPRQNFFKRIWWDFPKQFWTDRFNKEPDDFDMFGIHLFCGEQGSGKTLAMVHKIRQLQYKYPKCQVHTNFGYKFEDGHIWNYKDVLRTSNGTKGVILGMDEMQSWFSSLESKDFPVEYLSEICMERKQRKVTIGSAQVFTRVAKPIREYTNYLYEPITVFGCLTIVRVRKPIVGADGSLEKKRRVKTYFFVHDKELRSMYDTYEKVKKQAEIGFSIRPDFLPGNVVTVQSDSDAR